MVDQCVMDDALFVRLGLHGARLCHGEPTISDDLAIWVPRLFEKSASVGYVDQSPRSGARAIFLIESFGVVPSRHSTLAVEFQLLFAVHHTAFSS